MTRYQLCFDPEGTELDNWEWCIRTKDDIQEHTTRREVKEYNSTGGDPVRLTIDILDIIF
jgi:hypothetical protein